MKYLMWSLNWVTRTVTLVLLVGFLFPLNKSLTLFQSLFSVALQFSRIKKPQQKASWKKPRQPVRDHNVLTSTQLMLCTNVLFMPLSMSTQREILFTFCFVTCIKLWRCPIGLWVIVTPLPCIFLKASTGYRTRTILRLWLGSMTLMSTTNWTDRWHWHKDSQQEPVAFKTLFLYDKQIKWLGKVSQSANLHREAQQPLWLEKL